MPIKNIFHDPDAQLVEEHHALVYAPGHRRNRFPENCVQLMPSEQDARARADRDKGLFAAKVLGPSRSSEGLRLYYLVNWLD
jgi:hypothetical protein